MDWLQAARHRFEKTGDYPLIDDEEIIESKIIFDFWPWFGGAKRDVDELREAALTADHLDPPVRFVYLNLFYRLSHYRAEQVAMVVDDQEGADGHRKQFEKDLETFVRLVDVDRSEDVREIRWEIVNACAIRNWDRADRLYARLEQIASEKKPEILAARGRFEFVVVCKEHWELEDLDLYWWAPIPARPYRQFLRLIISGNSVGRDFQVPLAAHEVNRLENAAHYLTKALRDRPGLDIVHRFVLLRCHLELGRFRDAAADCEILLESRGQFTGVLDEIRENLLARIFALSVRAYESEGQIERALATSDRWMQEFPEAHGIHECRSRLFMMQADFASAYEELRKEVEKNPLRRSDPGVEIALAFGGLYQDPEKQWKEFAKGISERDEARVRAVIRIHWPQLENLADHNLKDWVDSCYLLLRRTPDNPLMAMATITRVLEHEVRMRVFARFRKDLTAEEISAFRGAQATGPLAKYLAGDDRLAVGQMLNEIRFPEARTDIGRRFRQWLRDKNLLAGLQSLDLSRLYRLHIPGKHVSDFRPSWSDAEELLRLSRDLLTMVISHKTSGTPSGEGAKHRWQL